MQLWPTLYRVVISILITTGLLYIPHNAFCQEDDSFSKGLLSFPAKVQSSIDKRISQIDALLEKSINKQLSKIQKQEKRIYRKLLRKNKEAAENYLVESKKNLLVLKNSLIHPDTLSSSYTSSLDTLKSSFFFLETQNGINNDATGAKLKNSLSKIRNLENRLNKSEELRKFMRKRKEQLKEKLSQFGFTSELKKLNKQVYYYAQQAGEYKEMLADRKKLERKALELLSKNKMFRDFMSKHSMLARLFPSSFGSTDPIAFQNSMPGLQTRAQLSGLIQQQLSASGPNGAASFQQNFQDAQSQILAVKNKLLPSASGSSDAEKAEGFKPNNQKAKSFLKRLEYGTNIQTQKSTRYFPVTSDLAFSIGYKLNDRSIIGIGASAKVGWGRDWNHVKLSSQGLGLRSFVEWKIKGNFYVSGGYEKNYRNQIGSFSELRERSLWQESGLIGISKTVPAKTKFFKKTKLQVLWDFMSQRQIPKAQPILFRIGYQL